MKRKAKKFNRRKLGRDPAMGRLAFRTGMQDSRPNKLSNRNSKLARNELRKQIREI